MTADWGVIFGVTGFCVGPLSLVYARTQALHASRQADAANMATALQLQHEMSEGIFQHRMALIRDPGVAKMYFENVPGLSEALEDGKATLESVVTIRNAIDGLQDIYFLRKRGIVEEYHWRHWASAFNVIGRVPLFHLVYKNAVARNALDPEFAAYLRPLVDGGTLTDPRPVAPRGSCESSMSSPWSARSDRGARHPTPNTPETHDRKHPHGQIAQKILGMQLRRRRRAGVREIVVGDAMKFAGSADAVFAKAALSAGVARYGWDQQAPNAKTHDSAALILRRQHLGEPAFEVGSALPGGRSFQVVHPLLTTRFTFENA